MFEYNLTNNMPCPTPKMNDYTNLLQMTATRMQMSTILPNTVQIGVGEDTNTYTKSAGLFKNHIIKTYIDTLLNYRLQY